MKTRKALSLLVAVALVFSLCTPVLAAEADIISVSIKQPVYVMDRADIEDLASTGGCEIMQKAGSPVLVAVDVGIAITGRSADWEGLDIKKSFFAEGVEYTLVVEVVSASGNATDFKLFEGGGSYGTLVEEKDVVSAALKCTIKDPAQNVRIGTGQGITVDYAVTSVIIWEGEPGTLPVEEPEEPIEEPAVPGLDNFVKSGVANSFADPDGVPVWAAADIDAVWQYGLMKGYTETAGTVFKPDAEVTVAEVIAVVARIHSIYINGEDTLVQSVPWFEVYEDYCADNDLIDAAYMTDEKRDQPATRAEVADMLSAVLTLFNPEVKNDLIVGAYFNDVNDSTPYFPAIGLLLRAGITTGSDGFNFNPNDPVKRSECAAFYVRMIDPTARKTAPEKPVE